MLIIIMLIIIIIIIIIMLLCMVKRLGYMPYTYHRGHVSVSYTHLTLPTSDLV